MATEVWSCGMQAPLDSEVFPERGSAAVGRREGRRLSLEENSHLEARRAPRTVSWPVGGRGSHTAGFSVLQADGQRQRQRQQLQRLQLQIQVIVSTSLAP